MSDDTNKIKKFILWSDVLMIFSVLMTPLAYAYAIIESSIILGLTGGLFQYLSMRTYYMSNMFKDYLEVKDEIKKP